ncbi:MFS transporter [Algihabitans sp.]|uniref:MFS transporter n=1 Tax=Algihabitans sp. TaxID=2821514 RepID=UPI003BAC9534
MPSESLLAASQDSPRAAAGQLAVLHAAHFACHYKLLIFPTAVIALERAWGLDYGAALALGTPLYVAFALATLPAGWLGDRCNGDRLIALQFLGSGLAALAAGLAQTQLQFMAALAALGLFAAIYHPVGLAMVTRLSARRGRALAVNGVFGNLGLAAATLVTALLAEAYGWRSAFLVPGAVATAAGALHLLLRRAPPLPPASEEARTTPAAVSVSRRTQLRVLAVVLSAALFSGVVFNGVSVSLPKLFDERLDSLAPGLAQVGGYGALVFAVAAFAQLPVGTLLDRLGGRPVMLGLYALVIVALILLSQAVGPAALPLAVVAVTLMFAGIPITGWLMGRYVAVAWRSRAFALEYVLALGVSSSVVPAMAALHLAGQGFDRQYLLFAVCAAVVVSAASFLPRRS